VKRNGKGRKDKEKTKKRQRKDEDEDETITITITIEEAFHRSPQDDRETPVRGLSRSSALAGP
jgi:hypothetical protein